MKVNLFASLLRLD